MLLQKSVWLVLGLVVGFAVGNLGSPLLVRVGVPVPGPSANRIATRPEFERAIDRMDRVLAKHRAARGAAEQELQENQIAANVVRARSAAGGNATLARMATAAEGFQRRIADLDHDIDDVERLLARLRVAREQSVETEIPDTGHEELREARTLLLMAGVGPVVRPPR